MKILDNYNVGIYCRLSRDDGKKGKQESMSIENQKRLLTTNVQERGWNLTECYVDDGWSGVNFERPAYKRMLRDLKAKRINCLIVKSLDRLGRGSHTGDQIEEHFIVPQVRFISVSEGVDTINGIDYLMDLLHVINGLLPKVTSEKVKQIKKDAAKNGLFMNSQAPFGYMKSPQDKHKLIVDPDAAHIVRRLFSEYAAGDTGRMIADRLNVEGVDSPRFYYYAKTGKVNALAEEQNVWGSATVLQLLRNEVYLGKIVSGKREVASIKTKQIRQIPREDWVVVEGMHEPIVTRELWDRVQSKLSDKHRVYETKRTKAVGLFAGILKCADCGRPLAYSTKRLKNSEKGIYRCSKYNNHGGSKACTPHYIEEDDLIGYVLNDIKKYAVLSVNERERLTSSLLSTMKKVQSREAGVLQSKIREDEKRLLVIASTMKGLYEDKIAGEITKEMFQAFMRDYTKEQSEIEERLPRMRREVDNILEAVGEVGDWVKIIGECLNLVTLDRETVTGLIDHITVGERTKTDGVTTREIEISYRFIGSLLTNAKEDAAS